MLMRLKIVRKANNRYANVNEVLNKLISDVTLQLFSKSYYEEDKEYENFEVEKSKIENQKNITSTTIIQRGNIRPTKNLITFEKFLENSSVDNI
jgi:hypothetical protein